MFKYLFILAAFCLLHAQLVHGQASQRQDSIKTSMARMFADRFADSLQLTTAQRGKIFDVNIEIANLKTEARKKSTDRQEVGKALQEIEKSRDTRYKAIMTTEQYERYLWMKTELIDNKRQH